MGDNNVNAVAEISAELERERQKNAVLNERISMLEAQIRGRDVKTEENNQLAVSRSFNNFKRQKTEMADDEIEIRIIAKSEMASQCNPDTEGIVPEESNPPKSLINWMSMEDNRNLRSEILKDCDSVADFNETESDDACHDNYVNDMDNSQRLDKTEDTNGTVSAQKGHNADNIDDESNVTCMESFPSQGNDLAGNVRQEDHENQKKGGMLLAPLYEKVEVKIKTHQGKEIKEIAVPSCSTIRVSQNGKPQKVAFCPKEVKRITESESLMQQNAQFHTIRKIIVFASLGIRHGCEDMYELDFNHFSILKRGEPYGEGVLYENPGVRRKIFYPNRENPILCPVQILEEERAMRPSDASCPSWLFLCIKYGGSTRNVPLNEYVRQRMGRNKLKFFGPLMCRMAMLVHIRSGSFFFKALGITLLFMAGFPDDIVHRETKHRNLDLIQKYYRTDDDAEWEDLFLPHPVASNNGTHEPHNLTKKTLPAKSRGRKQASSSIKSHDLQKISPMTSSATQFGLTGYSSPHKYAKEASQILQDTTSHMPNPSSLVPSSGNHMMPPPPPPPTFVPVMYWPPATVFLPGVPYPSTFGYHSFPSTTNYKSFQTRPYYNHHPTGSVSLPKLLRVNGKNVSASDEIESDSHSSSDSSTKHKQGNDYK